MEDAVRIEMKVLEVGKVIFYGSLMCCGGWVSHQRRKEPQLEAHWFRRTRGLSYGNRRKNLLSLTWDTVAS
jgi:hypothetical protein